MTTPQTPLQCFAKELFTLGIPDVRELRSQIQCNHRGQGVLKALLHGETTTMAPVVVKNTAIPMGLTFYFFRRSVLPAALPRASARTLLLALVTYLPLVFAFLVFYNLKLSTLF